MESEFKLARIDRTKEPKDTPTAKKHPSLGVVVAKKVRALGIVSDRMYTDKTKSTNIESGVYRIKFYDLRKSWQNLQLVEEFIQSLLGAPGFIEAKVKSSEHGEFGFSAATKKKSLIIKFRLDVSVSSIQRYLNGIKVIDLSKVSKTSVAVCPHCGK